MSQSLRRHVAAALFMVASLTGLAAGPVAHAAASPPAAARAAVPPAATERDHVRSMLAVRRAAALGRLHQYALAGRFPHEYDVAPALHVFRDDAGRLCAVANLVHLDGHDDLVAQVAASENDLAIADVKTGPLHDWILGSGFTQEELVRIQKPAPMVERQPMPRPAVAAGDPLGQPMTEAEMNAAMLAHLHSVEAELRAKTPADLEVAVDRYLAAHAS